MLYALAVWRVSNILVLEEGPFELGVKLREVTGIQYNRSEKPVSWPSWNPLYCVYCTSVWVAGLLLWAPDCVNRLFAASAVTVLIEKALDGYSEN